MFKTATLIGIGLCFVASQAFADTGGQSESTLTLASNSNLCVRVASPSSNASLSSGNVCGAAVNTSGVTRATTAVKVGGRVFLTGGQGVIADQMRPAPVTRHGADTSLALKSPKGLGTLLAGIFGLSRS